MKHYNQPQESIDRFQDAILKWFSLNGRKFPWRKKRLSAYQLILSEILLQRTKAETVKNYYQKFFQCYGSWKGLSQASEHEIETVLRPLGLSQQRSERLYALAQEVKRRGHKFPTDVGQIEQLPMMGQYIVNSIKLLILSEPAPLLDVNMARLLERYFGDRIRVDIRYDKYLQSLAQAVITHEKSKELNWGIIDYAAIICRSKKPLCGTCVLQTNCTFYKQISPVIT